VKKVDGGNLRPDERLTIRRLRMKASRIFVYRVQRAVNIGLYEGAEQK
jgi:beta-lactamase class A